MSAKTTARVSRLRRHWTEVYGAVSKSPQRSRRDRQHIDRLRADGLANSAVVRCSYRHSPETLRYASSVFRKVSESVQVGTARLSFG